MDVYEICCLTLKFSIILKFDIAVLSSDGKNFEKNFSFIL